MKVCQIVLGVALAACSSSSVPEQAPRREASSPIAVMPASAPPTGTLPVNAAHRSLERYERIVRNVEDCALEGYQIVPTCAGMHELAAGMAKVPADVRADVGRAMIGHTSPAVRVKSAELMNDQSLPRPSGRGSETPDNVSHGKVSRESQDAIADAATREQHPGVLRAFIRVVADHGAQNPNVARVLLAAADHANPAVRLQAVYALSSASNRGLAGGSTKLAALAERDSDPKVRHSACEYAGKLGGDDLIPLYEKLTASSADADLYAACMEGLVRMFHNAPVLDTHNERAYRLFLTRLSATPRSETSPPWNVMSTFCYFGRDAKEVADWKLRAPWFDAAEAKRVMASVIADPKASAAARTAAVESIVGLGATKPELEALRRTLDAKDKSIADKLVVAH